MSSTVCAEQLQIFHTSQQKSHHLHNIDVPPRKQLFSRRSSSSYPKEASASGEEALFRKFLPYNSGYDDDEDDPYSADHFRMFEFKIRRCTRSRSHDWTDCPFAHPGEKARPRDPKRFAYSGMVCPEFGSGGCLKSDFCEFAHGVLECWLHPARYRTEACKEGKNCLELQDELDKNKKEMEKTKEALENAREEQALERKEVNQFRRQLEAQFIIS